MNIYDGLKSLIGNLGNAERDKSANVYFVDKPIPDEQLYAAFSSNWIARKIVMIPVQDAVRKWRVWGGESGETIKLEERRLKLKQKVAEALWKARLLGGAAIFIGTDQDPMEPLDVSRIGKDGVRYLTVLTRRELTAGEIDQDPLSELYGTPKDYTIAGARGQLIIHPSRLAIFIGDDKPDVWISDGASHGWGNSVIQAVHDTITQTGGAFASVASLVFEANVDVISIPGLMKKIGSEEYESSLLKRFRIAAANKSVNASLILDADEKYDRKATSFSQLPEVMQAFAMFCSAAADIPSTRFLAQSPNGLNSTGESDMNNYYDKVEALQTGVIEDGIERLDACLVRSALGSGSSEGYTWVPLKQLTAKEQADIGKVIGETVDKISNLFTEEELREITVRRMTESGAFPRMAEIIEEADKALES